MSCLMGDNIREGEVQNVITQKISDSFMMIADITKENIETQEIQENINTLIEAGIAQEQIRIIILSQVEREENHHSCFEITKYGIIMTM